MNTTTIDNVTDVTPIKAAHAHLATTQASQLVTTPDDLLRMAVSQGADIEKLERLMALKERFEANEAKRKFNEAFAAFKSEAVRVFKSKLITDGPLKGKRHSVSADIVNAATPALSLYGLSTAWKVTKDEPDWIEITCFLKHAAGHFETVSMGGPPDKGPGRNVIQTRCSTKTYLERYTLLAILGLASEDEDDDGAGGATDGDAEDPRQQLLNILLEDLKEKMTDEAARMHYVENTKKLCDLKLQARFKAAVVAHRTALKQSATEEAKA